MSEEFLSINAWEYLPGNFYVRGTLWSQAAWIREVLVYINTNKNLISYVFRILFTIKVFNKASRIISTQKLQRQIELMGQLKNIQ